jgi:hypothetical protein
MEQRDTPVAMIAPGPEPPFVALLPDRASHRRSRLVRRACDQQCLENIGSLGVAGSDHLGGSPSCDGAALTPALNLIGP